MAKLSVDAKSQIKRAIATLERKAGAEDKKAPLRFTSGLLGVSHTTVRDWKNGTYLPKYEQLIECQLNILAAQAAVKELIGVITADLVVAEPNEKN